MSHERVTRNDAARDLHEPRKASFEPHFIGGQIWNNYTVNRKKTSPFLFLSKINRFS